MSKLSIVIPVYFNSDTLELLYADLKEKVLKVLTSYEIIMVDDGSNDNSWEVMKKIAAIDDNVVLVKLSRNFGSHAACLAGLSVCTGDCATIKSADLQEPSELLLEMFESWKLGNNVVLAARSDRQESFSQKLFANMYYGMIRRTVAENMPKGGFDCYLLDRKVIEVLKSLDETNSALTMQILWSGFQSSCIYYVRKNREIGKSRWTLYKKVKLVVDSVASFSFFPIRVMSATGIITFFIAIIWGAFVFINKLLGNIQVTGWTTLAIVVLFSNGLIMLMLGILGEYVWRGVNAARNRPVFIMDEYIRKNSDNSYTINRS